MECIFQLKMNLLQVVGFSFPTKKKKELQSNIELSKARIVNTVVEVANRVDPVLLDRAGMAR